MSTICLCMIVKNESKIIHRCLDSVFRACNLCYISICDTGSTDNTIDLIYEWGKRNGIETTVHQEPFVNFAHNRTISARFAKKTYPQADYLAFIDADMLLMANSKFMGNLTATSYEILVKSPDLYYGRTTFVDNNLDWKSIGVTHEYWGLVTANVINNKQRLLEVWIVDVGDGGCKADKFQRDIRLLTQGLIDEPVNERYMFYLAQSYWCIGQYEEAIKWYTKRVEAKGWDEEQWFAAYKISRCYFQLQKFPKAIDMGLKAFAMRPTRIEPLYYIIKHYRETKYHKLAYQFCFLAPLQSPPNDILFVEQDKYSYLIHYELSIVGFYADINGKRVGKEACYKILYSKEAPEWMKEMTRKNLEWYLDKK